MGQVANARGQAVSADPTSRHSSRRLLAAAEAERNHLERELQRETRRAATAAAELQRAVEAGHEVRQRLVLLEQLTGQEPARVPRPSRLEVAAPPAGFLRGAQIRLFGVRLLAASPEAHRPIHYTNWFELLQQAGYGIDARDPLATFLTQVSRSPVVVRAGEPGTYLLDREAPLRLAEELGSLHLELSRLHDGQQTIDGVVSIREKRLDLTTKISQVERALHEALNALGLDAAA
jgi:hypothetical protein